MDKDTWATDSCHWKQVDKGFGLNGEAAIGGIVSSSPSHRQFSSYSRSMFNIKLSTCLFVFYPPLECAFLGVGSILASI